MYVQRMEGKWSSLKGIILMMASSGADERTVVFVIKVFFLTSLISSRGVHLAAEFGAGLYKLIERHDLDDGFIRCCRKYGLNAHHVRRPVRKEVGLNVSK
ncbi:hypothetical protein AVEN_259992-1 [Araneus ventricosus]|uniref:Uncharacterized protein n=1 Tax=Araneus ventricosus TaxID=182803 RepID=A0A4Y2UQI4_ARAVE|nr:hypothetical protein AVEN_259992-1 [Araneus ventricosus]